MSGQDADADAVPSRTLVGESSDYTHVCIMVGHDDDVVLDPRLFASRPRNAKSRWEGQQSDMAIAQSMLAQFPQLRATFARTNEDLLATDAKVMLCADTNVRGLWAAAHRGAGQLGPGEAPLCVRRTRAGLGRAVRTMCRGTTGRARALVPHPSLVRLVCRVLPNAQDARGARRGRLPIGRVQGVHLVQGLVHAAAA